ncbi:MAG: response regulator [Clostridia bacterium]|nr:response regulator [Clostridia bacterium]
MKTILIDDERPALSELEHLILCNGDLEIAGSYTDPMEALKDICFKKPDVVFLDVVMPGTSGLYMAKKILEINKDIEIVFVSAYEEYGVEGFELGVADYILKPVSSERLSKAIQKVMMRKEA